MKTKEELYAKCQEFIQADPVLSKVLTDTNLTAPHNLFIGVICTFISYTLGVMDSIIQTAQNVILRLRGMSKYWYIQKCLDFQYGDTPEVTSLGQYEYPVIDNAKKIIKYVEVINPNQVTIKLKVAKQVDGKPAPLNQEELNSFTDYVREMTIPNFIVGQNENGVEYNWISSLEGDKITIVANCSVDGEVFIVGSNTAENNGKLISTGEKIIEQKIIDTAIATNYGNTFSLATITQAVKNIGNTVGNINYTLVKGLKNGGLPADEVDILAATGQEYKPYGGFIKEVDLTINYTNFNI